MLDDYKQLSVTADYAGPSSWKWTAISRNRFHRYARYRFANLTHVCVGKLDRTTEIESSY